MQLHDELGGGSGTAVARPRMLWGGRCVGRGAAEGRGAVKCHHRRGGCARRHGGDGGQHGAVDVGDGRRQSAARRALGARRRHPPPPKFTAVYRLHPMLPDSLPVGGPATPLTELIGKAGEATLAAAGAHAV